MKLIFNILLFASILTVGCSRSNANQAKKDNPQDVAMVGADKDSHGCIGSAGYTWSIIKNECIRVFEAGIRLDPKDASLDQTLSAFVVFKAPGEKVKAEVFLPGEKDSKIYEKQASANVWKGGNMTLKFENGMYSIEDNKKKLLYQGAGN